MWMKTPPRFRRAKLAKPAETLQALIFSLFGSSAIGASFLARPHLPALTHLPLRSCKRYIFQVAPAPPDQTRF